MSIRRVALFLGFGLVVASAAHPAGAEPAVDATGAAYGGAASGGWACGPSANVRYGGLGGEVRVFRGAGAAATSTQPAEGLVVTARAAAEARAYRVVTCAGSEPAGASPCQVPTDGKALGLAASVGDEERWWGLNGGLLAFSSYAKATSAKPTPVVIPTINLRFGDRGVGWGEIGLGSYNLPTVIRPGAYVGGGFAPAPGFEIHGHLGVHAVFEDSLGYRGDLGVQVPVSERVQIGAGGALSTGLGRLEPEGRLEVSARF